MMTCLDITITIPSYPLKNNAYGNKNSRQSVGKIMLNKHVGQPTLYFNKCVRYGYQIKKTHGNYSETTQYVTWRSLIQTDSEKESSICKP